MDGLARVAGMIEDVLELNGVSYRIATPLIEDWASAEAQSVLERNNVLKIAAEAAASVPPDQRDVFWQEALRLASLKATLSLRDLANLSIFNFTVFCFYLATRRYHADEIRTMQDARERLLRDAGRERIEAISARLQYVVECGLKNSNGPTAAATASNTST